MIITDIPIYDGSTIHDRFAYKFFRKDVSPAGNIIAFRAPMLVEAAGMIDREDLLTNDFIYSADAVNLCWEIPNLDPLGAVCFQRLFNTHIASTLSSKYLRLPIEVDGDDLMVHNSFKTRSGGTLQVGKCSVSIATSINGTALGHTGINIVAGQRAPEFAYSTNLSDEDALAFMQNCVDNFNQMVQDIFVATSKVITSR